MLQKTIKGQIASHLVFRCSQKLILLLSILDESYRFRWQAAFQFMLLLVCCVLPSSNLFVESANGQAKTDAASDKEKVEPEKVTLETKDKVELVCTYFAPGVPATPEAKEGDAAD